MSSRPTISVLMSVYNGEAFVGQAVESILAQTFGDFEFLILDDGSKDGSMEALRPIAERDKRQVAAAIVRVEQLYPSPVEELLGLLETYPNARELVWLQEEPENMGAWGFVRPLIEELAEGRWPLCYVGRARSASPAEGTMAWHAVNQKTLVAQAFEPAPER